MLLLRFAKNSLIQHDTTVDRKNPAPVEVGTSSLFHICIILSVLGDARLLHHQQCECGWELGAL